MGLFSKPVVTCGVCGKEIGGKEKRWATKDGFLCPDCQKPFTLNGPNAFIKYTSEEMKVRKQQRIQSNEFWDNNKNEFDSLYVTRKISNVLCIDDNAKKWYLYFGPSFAMPEANQNAATPIVFDFSDIERVYLSLGDKVVSSVASTKKNSSLGNVLLGGLIAGDAGAILGGMLTGQTTTIQSYETQRATVNIIIRGSDTPIPVTFNNKEDAFDVKNGFASIMPDAVIDNDIEFPADNPAENDFSPSSADEIRKFKTLLDEGIITQEEFDAKKKQLLGL